MKATEDIRNEFLNSIYMTFDINRMIQIMQMTNHKWMLNDKWDVPNKFEVIETIDYLINEIKHSYKIDPSQKEISSSIGGITVTYKYQNEVKEHWEIAYIPVFCTIHPFVK